MIKEIGILVLALSVTYSPLMVGADIYEYDILNRLTKVIYEDGSYVEYEYDANGNITNTYVYDATPEEDDTDKDDTDKDEADNNEGDSEGNGDAPTDSGEESEEGGDSTEGDSDIPEDFPENEDEPIEKEENIVTQIVSAIRKIFTGFVNWFKSLF